MAVHNYHRARFCIASAFYSDDHAIFHLGLAAQRRLQVFGINIRPSGSDNDFLFAALEIKIACLIERADVASAVPAFCIRSLLRAMFIPVSRSHAATAHQDFAVLRQLHLASRQYFSNRSLAETEGMVDADQGCGLRQPVSLDYCIAESSPEFFGFGVECCAT